MVKINIRELAHHLAEYLEKAQKGERIVVMRRHKPIAEIVPHQKNVLYPPWKRKIKRIKLKSGISMSEEIIKMREEETR